MPNKTIVPPFHCLNSCFFPEILNPISSTFPLQITKALKRNKMLENFNSAFFAKRSIKFSKNESKYSRQTADDSEKYNLIINFA